MDFHNFRTSGELPKYASPFERNYISYYDAVRAFNGLLHLRISSLLTGILGQTPGIAFATTGSDGRYEKGPGSKVELLVIKRKNGIDVVEKAQKLVTSPPFSQLFDPTEVKELETDTFSYYRNDPTRVYPTRIFDMKFLHGDTKCLAEAYEKVIEEIKAPIGRRIKEHMSAHKRRAKVLMETGEQSIHAQNVQHYNLEA